MNPETWILQRILSTSEDVDLVEDLYLWMLRRHGSCREFWDTKLLRHESGEMDLAEDPYWWMLKHESDTWIRRHGSCRGSWDINGRWDMYPETWTLQRIREVPRCLRHDPKTWILYWILRYIWLLSYGSDSMDRAKNLRYTWMLRHEC